MKKLIYVLLLTISVNCFYAQTNTKIKADELPEIAKAELDKKFKKYEVNSVVKKEDEQKNITYEVELQKSNSLVYLVYDLKGTLISKNKSKIFSFDNEKQEKKAQPKANDGHNHSH